jgi:DNA-binding CsgD family transcriptional regulator
VRPPVEKNISPQRTDPPMPRIPSADHLFDLFTSFTNLQQRNRHLVGEMRGSIDRLCELRRELHWKSWRGRAESNGDGDRELSSRFGLTRREEQVAILLAQGRSNQVIARELQISVHTARHHTQRILSKLKVHSRGEAGSKIRS